MNTSTIKRMLRKASNRDNAEKRLRFWANALGIKEDEIYNLPSPQEAQGSFEAIDIAVKKQFGNLLKQPNVMARILGSRD